jgi:disulfide bond formation protein DsbB
VRVVETMQVVTAVCAIAAVVGALLLIVARVLAPHWPLAARWGAAVSSARPALTLIVASGAMLGSLYFSEEAGYIPCRLCWFQRIAMYPIAVIALVALIRRDAGARWYVVPLASIGALISTWHYLIEWNPTWEGDSCGLFGPACADVWFRSFGFVSLAFMALAGFVSIIVFNVVSFPPTQDSAPSPAPPSPVPQEQS